MNKEYTWSYLKDCKIRIKHLLSLLEGKIQENDVVLDVGCGYSPLGRELIEKVKKIIGFDTSKETIAFLKENYKEGMWKKCTAKTFFENKTNWDKTNILLNIGWNPEKNFNFLISRYIEVQKPKLILNEIGIPIDWEIKDSIYVCKEKNTRINSFNKLTNELIQKDYNLIKTINFNSKTKTRCSNRLALLFKKKNN